MVRKKETTPTKLLTEVELELMNAIWDNEPCTVREVQQALPEDRDLAYTSVATIVKILEKKGMVLSQKTERAHVYSPKVTRDDYEKRTLDHLVGKVFQGAPSSLVMRLLSDSDLSHDELTSIRNSLNERLQS